MRADEGTPGASKAFAAELLEASATKLGGLHRYVYIESQQCRLNGLSKLLV